MWPERSSWKKVGRKRCCSILVGRISVNVKPAKRRKAQKRTGFTAVQNGTRSEGRSQRTSESGRKRRERRRKSGSEASSRTLSVKAKWNRVHRVFKCESEKHKSWGMPVEGWERRELVVGPWFSLIMMKRWSHCMGCMVQWRTINGGADGLLIPSQESDWTRQSA